MRGGAFFNGKEGRDDFRKTALRAVTSFPFREGFLSPVRGTERVVKPIVAWLGCGALLAGETERSKKPSIIKGRRRDSKNYFPNFSHASL